MKDQASSDSSFIEFNLFLFPAFSSIDKGPEHVNSVKVLLSAFAHMLGNVRLFLVYSRLSAPFLSLAED